MDFHLYKVPSKFGDWLAVFEDKDLVFLGHYSIGKKALHAEVAEFFHLNYGFHSGSFTPAIWAKGNFWNRKHRIKLQGTEFQMKVWLELIEIPRGRTSTYSQVAKKIGKPTAYRAVASAVAKNPIAYWIPCHRVVGKNTSAMKYHWGTALKRQLLEEEK